MLRAAGVEEFDEQVYRALLRKPSTSLAELAVACGSGPSRVRGALLRLEDQRLVRRTPQRGFVPVAPEVALVALIQRREAELGVVRADVLELAEMFRTGRLEGHPAELVEVVTGADAILRRARELNDGSQEEILAFDKPPYMFQPDDREIDAERPLLQRGVAARAIYSREAVETPQRPAILSRLAALGEEARILPKLPFKLRIYDRRVAIVPLTTDEHATESVAIVHRSGLLVALIALFEAYWDQAHPLVGDVEDRPAVLTDDDVEVLRLMNAGLKDEAIARQLGVSMRTVRRRVVHLMDLLHASTRFQAGAQATRRGWI
jgi:DNA-binding CsgD family transcriptional regulator/sugar-specific transcriptional regulator TrmB